MRKSLQRLVCLLLTAAITMSLFVTGTFSAAAATYSYNPGIRGEVCSSLSSAAESYYTGSYTYATLSQQSGSTLQSTLYTLMQSTHSKLTSYDDLKTLTQYSDAENGSSDTITLFYSSLQVSGSWDGGTTWNREHVWCQSLGTFTTSNCGSDLHHLRPSDPKANSTRNNLPFGVVTSGSSYKTATTNSGQVAGYYTSSCFEPLDNVKGDVARILLYCYVRWEQTNLTSLITSTSLLLSWCQADPVDTWEMGRNDVVQSIQGNRNVFIDYPELAWLLFDQEIPEGITTPSSGSAACTHSRATTTTEDPTCTQDGLVTVTCDICGEVLSTTALPATGHQYLAQVTDPTEAAQGYTTYTCTVCGYSYRDNYLPALGGKCYVHFVVPQGVDTVVDLSGYAGQAVTLPTPTGTPEADGQDYTFCGWTAATVTDATSAPAYFPAGDSYTIEAESTVLYALYTYSVAADEGSTVGDARYVRVTETPDSWAGEYLIVAPDYGVAFDGSLSNLDSIGNTIAVDVDIEGNTISAEQGDGHSFTIAPSGDGYTILSASGLYIGTDSNSNSLISSSNTYQNTISLDEDGFANIISDKGAYLRYNASINQCRFRYYKSSTYTGQKAVCLFVRRGSDCTAYYTTELTYAPDATLDTGLTLHRAMGFDSQIQLFFYIGVNEYPDYSEFKVSFTQDLPDGTQKYTESTGTVEEESLLCFTLPLAAKEMADSIAYTLYGYKDGQWYYGETQTRTVRQEATSLLGLAGYESKYALLVNMLNYGAAAQIRFSYREYDLANSQLTAQQAAWGFTDPGTLSATVWESGTEGDVRFLTPALSLASRIEVDIPIQQGTYTQDQLQAVVAYTDRNGQAQELTLGSEQMTVVSGYTVLSISAIPAADLEGELQITFVEKDSGQAVSSTLHYGVEAHVQRTLESSATTTADKNLCQAMMCYVQAAKTAFSA